MAYPYDPNRGQRIRTDGPKLYVDRFYGAHFNVPAADAVAENAAGVMALTTLAAAAASIITGLTSPAAARNVKVVANKAGITTKVKVYGTDLADAVISEELTLNGVTSVLGTSAFKTITKVDLPIRTNAPAKQKGTIAVTAGASGAGSTVFTFTSAITGAAFDISVPFAAEDTTTTLAAAALVIALNANATFAAAWLAASSGANVTIESQTYEAQDASLNLTVKTAGTPAVTVGSMTVNTVAGVIVDKVSVGLGKKFGIPYKLAADELVAVKLFNNSADTGTVTVDSTALKENGITLNGTPDGEKPIDLYIFV